MPNRPPWWEWGLELSPHLGKRMVDRRFTEVDLRLMLEVARSFEPSHEEGRWLVQTTHESRTWAVVVEPLLDEEVVVVITAYPTGGQQ